MTKKKEFIKDFRSGDADLEKEPKGSVFKHQSKEERDMNVENEERHILAVEEDEDSINIKYAKVADVEEIESSEYTEEDDDEIRFNSEETSYRSIDLARAEYIDEEKRTVRIALSSEEPVERSFGIEILDHSRESVDMEWAKSGSMPVLLDHDSRSLVGIVESFELDSATNRTLAQIRFGKSAMAQEAWQDVLDGIRKSVSVGYRINSMVRDEEAKDATFRANWTPMEASLVSIPADTNPMVGVARSQESAETEVSVNNNITKEIKMTEEVKSEVNLDEVRSEATIVARSAVAKEAKEIMALATAHNKRDLASLIEGHTVEQFRGILLDNLSSNAVLETPIAEVGLNKEERKSYSLLNAVRASISNDWTKAGLEREISNEIASRTGKDARGFYLPTDLSWGQRDQNAGTNSAGGFLVGEDYRANEFVGALYGSAKVAQLGARVLSGLQGDVAIPKMATSVTNTAFVAEGSAPTEGASTFAQVTLSPKTLATFVDYTRKLTLQSDPSIEQVLRNDIIQTMANKIDTVAIQGGASNEPSGILTESDATTVAIGTNGGAITYANLAKMDSSIDAANGNTGVKNYLTTPGVIGNMRLTSRQANGVEGNFILNEAMTLLGHQVHSTTNVPSNLTKGNVSGSCHAVVLGDFSQVMMGFWSGVDVIVDTSTLSSSGGVRLAFFQDCDVAVRQPEAFALIKDVVVS